MMQRERIPGVQKATGSMSSRSVSGQFPLGGQGDLASQGSVRLKPSPVTAIRRKEGAPESLVFDVGVSDIFVTNGLEDVQVSPSTQSNINALEALGTTFFFGKQRGDAGVVLPKRSLAH